MAQDVMIEEIVREVLKNMYQAPQSGAMGAPAAGKTGLCPDKDYPLAEKHPELVKTAGGKSLNDITFAKLLDGQVTAEDLRISPATLQMQAEIAEGVGRTQFAANLRRAAELTAIPDNRILEIYNALRPKRSTKVELLAIADEMEHQYKAIINANLVREAADVYERRNQLRAE